MGGKKLKQKRKTERERKREGKLGRDADKIHRTNKKNLLAIQREVQYRRGEDGQSFLLLNAEVYF